MGIFLKWCYTCSQKGEAYLKMRIFLTAFHTKWLRTLSLCCWLMESGFFQAFMEAWKTGCLNVFLTLTNRFLKGATYFSNSVKSVKRIMLVQQLVERFYIRERTKAFLLNPFWRMCSSSFHAYCLCTSPDQLMEGIRVSLLKKTHMFPELKQMEMKFKGELWMWSVATT